MFKTSKSWHALSVLGAALMASTATADVVTIDFSTEDDGVTPLANAQHVESPAEFGTLFTISASGNNLGAAIFDSDPAGPNLGGGDADLLVDLGNVLILQDTASPDQTTSGFFDDVNDSNEGGTITFGFLAPVELTSITLIDIDNNAAVTIVLTDSNGLERTYEVDDHFTFDVASHGSGGFDTLDLTSLAEQVGEGGGSATATQDAGFNAADVWSMSVTFSGSGAMDNLTFSQIPAPGTLALLGLAALCGASGRRRKNLAEGRN